MLAFQLKMLKKDCPDSWCDTKCFRHFILEKQVTKLPTKGNNSITLNTNVTALY